jgi:DNA-binding transcriptional ArsR family regulator
MQAFIALADPVRARILEMLAKDDLPAGDIAAAFAISRPAVSRHLSVLLKSRLVRVREDAQRRIYGLAPEGLEPADAWIEEIRWVWNRRLDDLGRHLDALSARDADQTSTPAESPAKSHYDWEDEPDEPWRPLARRIPLPRRE